jgi:putative exporter of polyketide antibiotics
MQRETKMGLVIVVGVLHLMSGIAGLVVGGVPSAAGWTLVIIGLVLVSLGGLALRQNEVAPD